MKHLDQPDVLRALSDEDAKKLTPLSAEAIKEAIEAGERDRRVAESTPASAPIAPRMLYR